MARLPQHLEAYILIESPINSDETKREIRRFLRGTLDFELALNDSIKVHLYQKCIDDLFNEGLFAMRGQVGSFGCGFGLFTFFGTDKGFSFFIKPEHYDTFQKMTDTAAEKKRNAK